MPETTITERDNGYSTEATIKSTTKDALWTAVNALREEHKYQMPAVIGNVIDLSTGGYSVKMSWLGLD